MYAFIHSFVHVYSSLSIYFKAQNSRVIFSLLWKECCLAHGVPSVPPVSSDLYMRYAYCSREMQDCGGGLLHQKERLLPPLWPQSSTQRASFSGCASPIPCIPGH